MNLSQKLSVFAKTFRSALLTRWRRFCDSAVAWLRVRAQAPVLVAIQCCGGISTQCKTGIIFISQNSCVMYLPYPILPLRKLFFQKESWRFGGYPPTPLRTKSEKKWSTASPKILQCICLQLPLVLSNKKKSPGNVIATDNEGADCL